MGKITFGALLLSAFILSGCQSGTPGGETREENKEERVVGNYVSGALKEQPATRENKQEKKETMENEKYATKYQFAEIDTSLGKIKVRLYGADAPVTVENFLKLASEKFYDETKFHRVIKGFMIQGGDPNSKTDNASTWGMGGPGYRFKDEINPHKLVRGSLAMANSGPNTNGSQFFIVTAKDTPWLDGKHTNFGEVVEGMATVDKIEATKTGPQDRPLKNITVKTVVPLEK